MKRIILKAAMMIMALWASQGTIASERPTHTIVLVHGLLSDPTAFYNYADALYFRLHESRPDVNWNILHFAYNTGQSKGSTYQFAKDLDRFLTKSVQPLEPNDRFSLVMHSQGGIIGGIWLYFAAANRPGFTPSLLPHLDSYISMGTPFWGSRFSEIKGFAKPLGYPEFDSKEVDDLGILSNKTYDSRNSVLKLLTQTELYKQIRNIHFVNFAGILNETSMLGLNDALGLVPTESDGVVESSAAHLNFIYGKLDHRQINLRTPFKGFFETKMSDVFFVDAYHSSDGFDANSRTARSFTMVTDPCVKDTSCTHPTLDSIAGVFLRQNVSPRGKQVSPPRTFLVSVSIEMNASSSLDLSTIRWKAVASNGVQIDDGIYSSGQKVLNQHIRVKEIYGNVEKTNEKILRFYFTGRVTQAQSQRGNVYLAIDIAPGKRLLVQTPVRAGYSTFIDADLKEMPTARQMEIVQSPESKSEIL